MTNSKAMMVHDSLHKENVKSPPLEHLYNAMFLQE